MANVQLFAKRPDTGLFVQLDLHENEPIKLTFSVQDIEDPMVATSVFSRTFKVPHTSVNGPFFASVFNINCEDFDITQKTDAYIMDNGILFSNGNVRLNSIYINNMQGNVEYEVIFYGETSDLGSKIGAGFLNEINLVNENGISYNHEATFLNITKSWTKDLFSGDIVYGLIEWGYRYDADNRPISTIGTLSHGFANSFTSVDHPLKLEQFKPQFRAKALFDCIMRDAGYTYTSDFLNGELFKNLYIISEKASAAEFQPVNTFAAHDYTIQHTLDYTNNQIGLSLYYPYEGKTEDTDPGNNYNAPTSTYTAPATGAYTFVFNFSVSVRPPGYGETLQNLFFAIRIIDANGLSYGSSSWGFQEGDDGPQTRTISVTLNAGQTVRAQYYMNFSTTPNLVPVEVTWYQPKFLCTVAPTPLATSTILPNNIKKIDFMRSIINRFRLVFVPSKEKLNHFTITPWATWVNEGTPKDWTNKLDSSKDIKISPLFFGQNRASTFKDQEDSDFVNNNYQISNNQVYGQLNFDSNIELITGTKNYSDQFAPTPITPIGYKEGDTDSPLFLVPHMAKDTGSSDDSTGTNVITGKREPMQPKLRLVFYNGMVDAPRDWYMWKGADGTGAKLQSTTYPLMSSYERWPVVDGVLDINWKNTPPLWDITIPALGIGYTTKTVFTEYWKKWYDIIYDPYARIVDTTMILDYSDIVDFNFNDYVYVKDTWYLVNSISDYVAGQRTSCKVQLVKLGKTIDFPKFTPSLYTEVQLCEGRTNCEAFCCTGGGSYQSFWIDSDELATATTIYLDAQGLDIAGSDFYSDGVVCRFLFDAGYLGVAQNTSGCDCTVTPNEFLTHFGITGCIACADGVLITLYGTNATFELNSVFYLDAALTIKAGEGYYREDGVAAIAVHLNQYGVNIQIYSCQNCATINYPYHVGISTTACLACCNFTVQVVFTDSTVWVNSTMIYLSNNGTSPAPAGYYAFNGEILHVTADGIVDAIGSCSACDPCPAGPVEIHLSLFKELSGYSATAVLRKSMDDMFWTTVGTLEITEADGANTSLHESYFVEEGMYIKAVFGSNVVDGIINSGTDVNHVVVAEHSTACPNYISEFVVNAGSPLHVQVTAANYYELFANVDGGSSTTITYTAMELHYSTSNACVPYCGGGTVATYYADNLTLGTSMYIYTDLYGTTPAPAGFYSNHIVACEVGAQGMIIYFFNPSVCDCGISIEVYDYAATYVNTTVCAGCDTGTPVTIYATTPVLADVKVFYTNKACTIPIDPGYYTFNKNQWLEADSVGVIKANGTCVADCAPVIDCGTWVIVNKTLNQVKYTYTSCFDYHLHTGILEPDGYVETICCDIRSLQTSGYCETRKLTDCNP